MVSWLGVLVLLLLPIPENHGDPSLMELSCPNAARPQVTDETPLVDLLLAMPMGDVWADAGIMDCLEYVLASKYFKIPKEYEDKFQELFSDCVIKAVE